MKKIKYETSDTEKIIMEYLWKHTEGIVFAEIANYLNEDRGQARAKQTINTFLNRLQKKGLLITQKDAGKTLYYAAISKQEYEQGVANYYLEQFYEGSLMNFFSAFTGGKKCDEATFRELQEIIERIRES